MAGRRSRSARRNWSADPVTRQILEFMVSQWRASAVCEPTLVMMSIAKASGLATGADTPGAPYDDEDGTFRFTLDPRGALSRTVIYHYDTGKMQIATRDMFTGERAKEDYDPRKIALAMKAVSDETVAKIGKPTITVYRGLHSAHGGKLLSSKVGTIVETRPLESWTPSFEAATEYAYGKHVMTVVRGNPVVAELTCPTTDVFVTTEHSEWLLAAPTAHDRETVLFGRRMRIVGHREGNPPVVEVETI
ncbi:MAG: hypothetical protein WC683_02185 [bacterium]